MTWWHNMAQLYRTIAFICFFLGDRWIWLGRNVIPGISGETSLCDLTNHEALLPFCMNAVMPMVRVTWPIPDPACWSSSQAGHRPENRRTWPAFVLVCGSIEVMWGACFLKAANNCIAPGFRKTGIRIVKRAGPLYFVNFCALNNQLQAIILRV